jgi:hypothetical protein
VDSVLLDKRCSNQYSALDSLFQQTGAQEMKNVYEVLRQKELELARLEKEVEALRVAAPLLSDEKEQLGEVPKPALTAAPSSQPIRIPPVVTAQAAPATARSVGWEDAAKRWP